MLKANLVQLVQSKSVHVCKQYNSTIQKCPFLQAQIPIDLAQRGSYEFQIGWAEPMLDRIFGWAKPSFLPILLLWYLNFGWASAHPAHPITTPLI